ncbi:MAG: hypothetical protein FRX48_01229 [Lasallia pustulata]|uniref:Protein ZIP4 homolog n=1 Tax=Lasallia pustulata TaxID=136370 RepID=A0A5M8PZH8_9LECA|nr:MAG: hypothetical protein FRX48_01229 [Lasallia pustulata]
MAPVSRRRPSLENKLKDILDFAASLLSDLRTRNTPSALTTDLCSYLDDIPAGRSAVVASKFHDLDRHGTELWNLSAQLRRDGSATAELICLVRVFAYLLLDCAQGSAGGTLRNALRVFKVALRTTKHCLEHGQLNLAERVVEKAAAYEESLIRSSNENSLGDQTVLVGLSREYFIVRIAVAWRQNRLDIAEFMLSKLTPSVNVLDPASAESLGDILFEIGKDQHAKKQYQEAVRWLEMADDVLVAQSLENLSGEACDLKTSIMHTLVRTLMNLPGEDNNERAWNIVTNMDNEPGDRLVVLLLKLDLLAADERSPLQNYSEILERVTRTVHLTESNFKTIMHHVHKLKSRNADMTFHVLETLLLERLAVAEKAEWVEKALVTTIWIVTTSAGVIGGEQFLEKLFDSLHVKLDKPLGQPATHAGQMLLWKTIEVSYSQENYSNTERWCLLALHKILGNAGDLNNGKIQRKLILCAMGRQDPLKAREIYAQMSEMNQHDHLTQYLLYKVALRCGDTELAEECLTAVSNASSKDATLLYACVLEAQTSGNKVQATAAMQAVLEKYQYGAPSGVYLPALLRCTIRLLIHEMEGNEAQSTENIVAICKVFEGAAAQIKLTRRDRRDETFSMVELDWFSRNSYNLALKYCTVWEPSQTLGLLQTCLKFIDLYPPDTESSIIADLSLRHMFCDFLGGSLLVVLARGCDGLEDQLQYYLGVRKYADDFQTRLHEQLGRLEGGAKVDLQRKHATLRAFDFEAAVQLKAWADLEPLIKGCQTCDDPELFGRLADTMLCSEAPVETKITTLQQIINVTWRLQGIDIAKLSRWIRCLVRLAIPSTPDIAEHLLDQAITLAKDATTKSTPYPPVELEWLATTTFNRAVDFYCAGEDAACRRWADRALQLATSYPDEGAFRKVLQEKYLALTWEK